LVAEGKETREFNGRQYVLERSFFADFAIVKAWKGDTMGNLVFRGTARNFNPMVATASYNTIAEVEQLVPAGQIDPDHVHVPGIYVKRIFQGLRETDREANHEAGIIWRSHENRSHRGSPVS
jgi:3-oxoacid CoA-transferase subunit A